MKDFPLNVLADDPIEKLRAVVFTQAINANSVALAVLGWIIELDVNEPPLEEIRLAPDGAVMLRYADNPNPKPLCSLLVFLTQVGQLCVELGLTGSDADKVVSMVQGRLENQDV